MKVLKEVTETWTTDFMPNHTYLMDGDKVVAYKPWHEDDVQHLKGTFRLDRARRKFVELPFVAKDWGIEAVATPTVVQVPGSKGNTYRVNIAAETCDCPGHTYRGHCKHIQIARDMVDSVAA